MDLKLTRIRLVAAQHNDDVGAWAGIGQITRLTMRTRTGRRVKSTIKGPDHYQQHLRSTTIKAVREMPEQRATERGTVCLRISNADRDRLSILSMRASAAFANLVCARSFSQRHRRVRLRALQVLHDAAERIFPAFLRSDSPSLAGTGSKMMMRHGRCCLPAAKGGDGAAAPVWRNSCRVEVSAKTTRYSDPARLYSGGLTQPVQHQTRWFECRLA